MVAGVWGCSAFSVGVYKRSKWKDVKDRDGERESWRVEEKRKKRKLVEGGSEGNVIYSDGPDGGGTGSGCRSRTRETGLGGRGKKKSDPENSEKRTVGEPAEE
jgi:hypothetical protein